MTEEKRKIIDELRETSKQVHSLAVSDVTQKERLGTENSFPELGEMFGTFDGLMNKLDVCHFEDVPEKYIVALRDQVRDVIRSFDQIKKFQVAQGPNEKQNLVNQIRNQFNDAVLAATPILAVNAMRPFEDYKRAMIGFADQAHSMLAGIRNSVQEAKNATDSAKQAAKNAAEAATKTGVTEQAAHFQEEANRYLFLSRVWLVLIFVGLGFIIWLVLWTFLHPYEITPATKWLVIQRSTAKFLLFSVASFFLVFVVRNYNTSRHNHVVNQHRAKALATFQAFASDANDDETRKAVLMYAARAAFGHQTSGYLKKEGDYAGPSVIDIAKLLTGK